jgi:hypothetical protein
MGAQVVWDDGDIAVGQEGKRLGDRVGGAVVEEAMPEVRVLASGHQDGDFGVAGSDFGGDQFEGCSGDSTVGALDDVEW